MSQYELLTSQPRGPQDAAKQATKTQMKKIITVPAVSGMLPPVNVTFVSAPVATCTYNTTFKLPIIIGRQRTGYHLHLKHHLQVANDCW